MENKAFGKSFRPLLIVFLLTAIFLLAARWWVCDYGWAGPVDALSAGNLLLFMATALSFYFYRKALNHNNIHYFLRMMYSSLLIKMLICLGAALLYVYIAGKGISKAAILGCFGLYILYTFVEVKVLMRLSKPRKDA